jgi:DNA-binding MarR family transcriptional regulator
MVSRIVDQLEQRGFAKRTKRASNARVVEVRLTVVGEAVYDKVDVTAREITLASQSILSPPELDELNWQLVRLAGHVLHLNLSPDR